MAACRSGVTWHPSYDIRSLIGIPMESDVLFLSGRAHRRRRCRPAVPRRPSAGGNARRSYAIPRASRRSPTTARARASWRTRRSSTRSVQLEALSRWTRRRPIWIYDVEDARGRASSARQRVSDTRPGCGSTGTCYLLSHRKDRRRPDDDEPVALTTRQREEPRADLTKFKRTSTFARSHACEDAVVVEQMRRAAIRHLRRGRATATATVAVELERHRDPRPRRMASRRLPRWEAVRVKGPRCAARRIAPNGKRVGVRSARRDHHRCPKRARGLAEPHASRRARTIAARRGAPKGKHIAWFSDEGRGVPARGRGSRRGRGEPKRFYDLAGEETATTNWRLFLHAQLEPGHASTCCISDKTNRYSLTSTLRRPARFTEVSHVQGIARASCVPSAPGRPTASGSLRDSRNPNTMLRQRRAATRSRATAKLTTRSPTASATRIRPAFSRDGKYPVLRGIGRRGPAAASASTYERVRGRPGSNSPLRLRPQEGRASTPSRPRSDEATFAESEEGTKPEKKTDGEKKGEKAKDDKDAVDGENARQEGRRKAQAAVDRLRRHRSQRILALPVPRRALLRSLHLHGLKALSSLSYPRTAGSPELQALRLTNRARRRL